MKTGMFRAVCALFLLFVAGATAGAQERRGQPMPIPPAPALTPKPEGVAGGSGQQVRQLTLACANVWADGTTAGETFGRSATSIPDLNHDGFDDLVVGAPLNEHPGWGHVGHAYLVSGNPSDRGRILGQIHGEPGWEKFGTAVYRLGDIGHDGRTEVAICGPSPDVPQQYSEIPSPQPGRVYIFSIGPQDLAHGALHWEAHIDANLILEGTLVGDENTPADPCRPGLRGPMGDRFGYSVSHAGDVNGDGHRDVVIGAQRFLTNTNRFGDKTDMAIGRSYVYFLSPGELSQKGRVVSINDPGRLITQEQALAGARPQAGKFVEMKAGHFLDGLPAQWEDLFGRWVSMTVDINGDGRSNVVVGAPVHGDNTQTCVAGSPRNDPNEGAGRVYVYGYVAPRPGAPATQGSWRCMYVIEGEFAGDWFGSGVYCAGDVDRDGRSELLVSAEHGGPALAGRVYVFDFPEPTSAQAYPIRLLASRDAYITIDGQSTGDEFGHALTEVGDLNGDGLRDLVIGAFARDAAGVNAGRTYIINMPTPEEVGSSGAPYRMRAEGGLNRTSFLINGTRARDKFGHFLVEAPDMNGGGRIDLIVSAFEQDGPAGVNAGAVWVYFLEDLETTSLAQEADLNLDGQVNNADLAILMGLAGAVCGGGDACPGDLDGDGVVGSRDVSALMQNWNSCANTGEPPPGGQRLPPPVGGHAATPPPATPPSSGTGDPRRG